VSSVSIGNYHALALAEDGLVHASGENADSAVLGNPHVDRELLQKPVEALRGVRVASVAAADDRSYAVADTGELWACGVNGGDANPLGHGGKEDCPVPKPIVALRGVKVDAVAAGQNHALALADDGSVYAWGNRYAANGVRLAWALQRMVRGRLCPNRGASRICV
jgi:alpha-tubulin suppressor-like RCC1 family protein